MPGPAAPSLTAIVLTKNEAENIADCLASLAFAPVRLVLDCGSDDGTRALAEAAGARVLERPFDDFSSQRNFALAQAGGDWVLMIDADERVPEPLAREILAVLSATGPADPAAYRLRRNNLYLGKPLRFCGAGRDTVIRLLRRGRAGYVNLVHETPRIDGGIGDLATPLEHHTVRSLSESLQKLAQYSPLSALEMQRRGRRVSLAGIAGRTLARWIKIYIVKLGLLDGGRGFLVAAFESAGVFFKYALLWDMQRRKKE